MDDAVFIDEAADVDKAVDEAVHVHEAVHAGCLLWLGGRWFTRRGMLPCTTHPGEETFDSSSDERALIGQLCYDSRPFSRRLAPLRT